MKIKSIFFIVISSILLLCQSQQQKYFWEDLKKNSPGYGQTFPFGTPQYEPYECQTYLTPYVYIGTSPNNHIYKINPMENGRPIFDIGTVRGNNIGSVRALTNDGYFIYGAVSDPKVTLFFIQDDNIITFGEDIMMENNISFLLQPEIFNDGILEYIYFPAISNDHKLRLVRWSVPLIKIKNTPRPFPSIYNDITVFTINEPIISGNYLVCLDITQWDVQPIVVFGTEKNQLGIHNIYFEDSYLIHSDENLKFDQFVADPSLPSEVFLFNNDNYMYRCSVPDFNILETVSTLPGNDRYTKYLFNNDKIFTYRNIIDLNTNNVMDYSGVGAMRGRNIMTDGKKLFGFSKWGSDLPYIDIAELNNYFVNSSYNYNIPAPNIPPYGGGVITSLAVFNEFIFGSMARGLGTFVYNPTNPNWESFNNPDDCSSANEIFISNNNIYFGFYNKPYFAYRSITPNSNWAIFSGKNRYDLQQVIQDESQLHVVTMCQLGNKIYMGTYPRENTESGTTKAAIISYDINTNQFRRVGKVQRSWITKLSVVEHDGLLNHHVLYGSCSNGSFVYEFHKDNFITNDDIPANISINAKSIIIRNSKLYMLVNVFGSSWMGDTQLYTYNTLPQNNVALSNPSHVLHLDTAHVDGGDILIGNDGYLYALYVSNNYGTEIQWNYLEKIYLNGTVPLSNGKVYKQETGTNTRKLLYKFTNDKGNQSNKNIYAGFFTGELKKLVNGYPQEEGNQNIFLNSYPNPFNPSTRIKYQIFSNSIVTLKIFDILGNEIATLVNEEKQPGEYEIDFDGSRLSSGVYFYQLRAGSFIQTSKMILMK